jgi:hypothetical protein
MFIPMFIPLHVSFNVELKRTYALLLSSHADAASGNVDVERGRGGGVEEEDEGSSVSMPPMDPGPASAIDELKRLLNSPRVSVDERRPASGSSHVKAPTMVPSGVHHPMLGDPSNATSLGLSSSALATAAAAAAAVSSGRGGQKEKVLLENLGEAMEGKVPACLSKSSQRAKRLFSSEGSKGETLPSGPCPVLPGGSQPRTDTDAQMEQALRDFVRIRSISSIPGAREECLR